jgi:3-hydroxyisobutyrate dehydrogenase-like beta-hydroxyacid dehydrogenase
VYGKLIATQTSQPALFPVPLGLKDVREALAAAEAVEASLPLANVVRDSLISALAQGYAEHDWSVVAKVNAKRAGL